MDILDQTYLQLVALYGTSHPGSGFGLQFGILGTAASFFSVVVYVPRKRLKSLQLVGQKRHWLMLHMVAGLLGAFLVFVHATRAWSNVAGFSNLAMWGTVLSGILLRYFSVRAPLARLVREHKLNIVSRQVQAAMSSLDSKSTPASWRKIRDAFEGALAQEAEPRLIKIMGQFIRDSMTIIFLFRQIRSIKKNSAPEEPEGVSALLLVRNLILTREILGLKIIESGAAFWLRVHIWFFIAFGLFLGVHGAVVYLLKPRFVF